MNTNQVIINSPTQNLRFSVRTLGRIAVPGLVGLLLALLTLPLEFRDPLILAIAALTLVAAVKNFVVTWITFVLCLPFVYLMTGMFGQAKITGLRIFLLVFLGIFMLLPKPKSFWLLLRKNSAFVGLVLFFVANIISALVSGQIEAVFRTLTYVEPLAFFLLSYFVVTRRPENWKTLLWVIGVSGTYVILLGLLELAMQKPLVEILGIQNTVYDLEKLHFYLSEDRFGLGGRISSTLLQPVYAGLFFGMYLISQSYYIVTYTKRSQVRVFILMPLLLGMVILTGSRGPILSLGAALLVFITFNQRRGFAFAITVIGLGALAALIIYLIPGLLAYLQSSFDLKSQASGNLTQRFNVTSGLFETFKMHPIFGYGPGLIQKTALQSTSQFVGLAGLENQYATILADGGVVAGAAYLVFIYGVFALAVKAYRNQNRELQTAGTMLLTLAAYFFTVATSVNAISSVGGLLLVIIVGGLSGLYTSNR